MSSSKRRKVTVDIKQTKLERGSVFARLGNEEKRKKLKPDSESGSKSKKEGSKAEIEITEDKRKSKQPVKSEEHVSSKKSSKEYSSSSKTKPSTDHSKEYKKPRRYSEEREMVVVSETGRTHSKHKSDRGERKVEKIENIIIKKRVAGVVRRPSPSSSVGQSRSASPSSLSPKKKSKKHTTKHSSREISNETPHYQSESPERSMESHKHKERGRSREKKKSSKDSSKKAKDNFEDEDDNSKTRSSGKHLSSKSKKASKHGKYEKEYSKDFEVEKKPPKSKHAREISMEKDKSRAKISPVVYDHSSDDNHSRKREKNEDRGKTKQRKYGNTSPIDSLVRHKKSKRQRSAEDEDRSNKSSSPVKHSSKKRSHKEAETVSKKKVQKEDSLPGTNSDYSSTSKHSRPEDYSSTSKHSRPEFSEVSQPSGGNDDRCSSEYYAEKESKKRTKMKKKIKKDAETPPSKSHYEVIDDDFSEDVKKVKKRKRKREESSSPFQKSPSKEEQRYREKKKDRDEAPKKKSESYIQSPLERIGRSDKHPRDRQESYERRSPPQEQPESRRHQKISSEIKMDIRSPGDKYFEQRKERDQDLHGRRRDTPQEPRHTRDPQRYSSERRDQSYPKSQLPPRYLSPERNADSKVLDWQRKTSKHLSNERKEAIPRLMSVQYTIDRRGEVSRPPPPPPQAKFIPQRKIHDTDYSYSHDAPMGHPVHVPLDRGGRNLERRPPPLLPSRTFQRNRSPPRAPHIRDNRGYNAEQDRFVDTDGKHGKEYHREPVPRNDSRDRKFPPVIDETGNRHVRSGSRDSRSSFRHDSLENKGKPRMQSDIGTMRGGPQSPLGGRNLSLERRDHKKPVQERLKLPQNEPHTRRLHKSIDRASVISKVPHDRFEGGRPNERSRPLKRRADDSVELHRSGSPRSLQDGSKKKRISSKDPSPAKRRPRDSSRTSSKRHPAAESERRRSSRRRESREKSVEISEAEIDELIKEEDKALEVDWNELKIDAPKKLKETSLVLRKVSPGNVLRRTGIIMDMLPQHIINKITELETESAEKDPVSTESPAKCLVDKILGNGLHAYSDENLRKTLLGYNTTSGHPFYPPRVINAKTYAASMKEYMRKMRLVEAV